MEDRIYDIAGKKFSGHELAPEEEILFSEWLKDESNQLLYVELKKTWEISGVIQRNIVANVDTEWEKFKGIATGARYTKRINRRAVFYIAASIALIFGLFIGYGRFVQEKKIEYATDTSVKQISLPDGSVIWLNRNSSLILSNRFGKENRKVELSGEAYFKVEKSSIPFEIYSFDKVVTRVLGTEFDLRAYQHEQSTELTVVSGRVSFGQEYSKENKVYLKNQRAVISNTGKVIEENAADRNNLLAWQTGILIFDNSPVTQVIKDLSLYFNLEIEIPENSGNLNFTGKFNKPAITEIIDVLELSFQWKHSWIKNQLKFTNSGT
jgi:transmembrane sensor